MSSTQDRLCRQKTYHDLNYDNTVSRKVNSAKANRMDYCIVSEGEKPETKSGTEHRLVIVVSKAGNLIKTYYD